MNCENHKNIIITKHAYLRLKERNGWNRKASRRMISRIYTEGIRQGEVKGYLKMWVNMKCKYAEEGDEYILYGDKLYIFNETRMLTVITVPTRTYLEKMA